jgi:hypothetical protein
MVPHLPIILVFNVTNLVIPMYVTGGTYSNGTAYLPILVVLLNVTGFSNGT